MGQKIHPTGFRLAVTRNWACRWYASNRDFAGMLAEDIKVREYLKKKLKNASVVARPDRASRQERPHHDLLGASGRRDRQEGRRHREPQAELQQAHGRAGRTSTSKKCASPKSMRS